MKNQKGITLIALVITIIVMLILVGVSVTVALNGGLFTTAKNAADETETEKDKEMTLSSGRVKVGGKWYDSLEDYKAGKESADQSGTTGGNEGGAGTEYTIGTEVTIGETGENFYVIKDEGEELILLAKNNINTDSTILKQANGDNITANKVIFSSENYWASEEEDTDYNNVNSSETYTAYVEKWGKTYPRNLNNEEYDSVRGNDAVAKARQYAENTIGNGATGRLMTYEEAEPLSKSTDANIIKMLYGTYSEGASLSYWLGSAEETCYVCLVRWRHQQLV